MMRALPATSFVMALAIGTSALAGCGHIGVNAVDDAGVGDGGPPGDDGGPSDGPGDGIPDGDVPISVTSIAAGDAFVCAVRGGAVWCWGDNSVGQLGDSNTAPRATPGRVTSIDNAKSVVAGESHACALRSDGQVWCWGDNGSGQLGVDPDVVSSAVVPTQVTGLGAGAIAIAAGAEHTCAVLADATAWCWGANGEGQLAVGGDDNPRPQRVLDDVAEIAAGGEHTCARRKADDSVWCWGSNSDGQLGDGTKTTRATPMAVPGLRATRIALGGDVSCALIDGHYRCWGGGDAGRLGDSGEDDRPVPAPPSLLDRVTAISAGGDHSCAVNDGNVVCWGDGEVGQLGDGGRGSLPPVAALSDHSAALVAAGTEISCAVRTDGKVVCWGRGSSGQLGNGKMTPWLPQRVALPESPVVAVAAGAFHSCAIAGTTHSVYCWGNDDNGELGRVVGGGPPQATPAAVTGVHQAVQLALGIQHSCARLEDKTLRCWGDGDDGELGNNATDDDGPVQVSGIVDSTWIASGEAFSCTTTGAGPNCWGTNEHGELGVAPGKGSSLPGPVDTPLSAPLLLAAGDSHACAASADGVWCWGAGDGGQLGNGARPPTSVPVAVTGAGTTWSPKLLTAGGDHTCAVDTTGSVWCWGRNESGQLGDGTFGLRSSPRQVTMLGTPALDLAAAGGNTCARTNLGPRCWGDNLYGQLGDGTTASRAAPTAVQGLAAGALPVPGDGHACALSNGEVYCWGDNAFGQLGLGTFSVELSPVDVVFPDG
jgi:alpha-tubulin suppressor-like RCC1 family protein